MSANTVVTCNDVARYGGTGIKAAYCTFTGTASYDTGGSIIDLSSYFSDEVRDIIVQAQGTTEYQPCFVPGASNGAALGKIFLADGGGTQIASTTDLSGVTFGAWVIGTDA